MNGRLAVGDLLLDVNRVADLQGAQHGLQVIAVAGKDHAVEGDRAVPDLIVDVLDHAIHSNRADQGGLAELHHHLQALAVGMGAGIVLGCVDGQGVLRTRLVEAWRLSKSPSQRY